MSDLSLSGSKKASHVGGAWGWFAIKTLHFYQHYTEGSETTEWNKPNWYFQGFNGVAL